MMLRTSYYAHPVLKGARLNACANSFEFHEYKFYKKQNLKTTKSNKKKIFTTTYINCKILYYYCIIRKAKCPCSCETIYLKHIYIYIILLSIYNT